MPIKGSVGQSGNNATADVFYVQFLLSDWLYRGGNGTIAIDGLVGPETISTIQRFQKANDCTVDGRVDVDNQTINCLESLHFRGVMSGSFGDKVGPVLREYTRLNYLGLLRTRQAYFDKLRSGLG
jgi:hypothetical protein